MEKANTHILDGKTILEIPNFLSAGECKEAIDYTLQCKISSQIIINDEKYASVWWDKLKSRLPEKILHTDGKYYKMTRFTERVTISHARNPVTLHTDEMAYPANLYKLLVYLNKVTTRGGTIFTESEKSKKMITISPDIGKAVLFDIKLPHKGDANPYKEQKFILGASSHF